jgi:hypothetical protein
MTSRQFWGRSSRARPGLIWGRGDCPGRRPASREQFGPAVDSLRRGRKARRAHVGLAGRTRGFRRLLRLRRPPRPVQPSMRPPRPARAATSARPAAGRASSTGFARLFRPMAGQRASSFPAAKLLNCNLSPKPSSGRPLQRGRHEVRSAQNIQRRRSLLPLRPLYAAGFAPFAASRKAA